MKILSLGQTVEITKTFLQEEINNYNQMIGDSNPIHYDLEYARKTVFGKPIVPGILVSSLFGGILGNEFPGKGTILIGESMNYRKPVYIGEKIKSVIELIKIRKDKGILTFKACCFKANGELAIEGEAVVMYRGEYLI